MNIAVFKIKWLTFFKNLTAFLVITIGLSAPQTKKYHETVSADFQLELMSGHVASGTWHINSKKT